MLSPGLPVIMAAVVMAFPRLVIPEKAAEIDTQTIEIKLLPLGAEGGEMVILGAPDLSQPAKIE